MKSIGVVIPAYNEAAKIKQTLGAVQGIEGITSIIVVNDGSTDETAARASEAGVQVINLESNRGKGGAMNAALAYIKTDLVVFLDADLGESAREARHIIQPVAQGKADLCIAAFPPPRRKGGFGIVKGAARWALKKAGQTDTNAPLSGQRAMTRQVLEAVTPFSEAYGVELSMTIRALSRGFKVLEIPTAMTHNETGRDLKGFLHRGRQLLDVIRVIWQEMRRKAI